MHPPLNAAIGAAVSISFYRPCPTPVHGLFCVLSHQEVGLLALVSVLHSRLLPCLLFAMLAPLPIRIDLILATWTACVLSMARDGRGSGCFACLLTLPI